MGQVGFWCQWVTEWINEWVGGCEREWFKQSLKWWEWMSDWDGVREKLNEIVSISWRSEGWEWIKR